MKGSPVGPQRRRGGRGLLPHHLLLLLALLPALVSCRQDGELDYDDDDDDVHDESGEGEKHISPFNGHSLLDLSSLGVLAALKLKFVVVLLIALAVFFLVTKGYSTKCLFGNCRGPGYSPYGYYPYVDYTYVGYEVPAGYRRPGGAEGATPVLAKDSHHLSELTARVWNSIDIAGMAFSALNIQEDDCRRKLVCQADRAAASNPLLRAALSWFSSSLARYRTDRSRLEGGAEWRQEDPCEDMYPRCLHHDLPPSLGGPDPEQHVYLEPQHHSLRHQHHHHHHHHQGLVEHAEVSVEDALPPESWQPSSLPAEYHFVYPPSPYVAAGAPGSLVPQDGLFASPAGAIAPSPAEAHLLTSHHADPGAGLREAGALASAAATPSAATVLAPVVSKANLSTATAAQSSPGAGDTAGVVAARSPDGSPRREPEPRSPAPPPGGGPAGATPGAGVNPPGPPAPPQVWRRVLFGAKRSGSKEHLD